MRVEKRGFVFVFNKGVFFTAQALLGHLDRSPYLGHGLDHIGVSGLDGLESLAEVEESLRVRFTL